MKIRKCWECRSKMVEKRDIDPNGIPYRYWGCEKCGEEVLDMEQLHESALMYKKLRKLLSVKVSRWGTALALRIPKEIVISQKIKPGEIVRIQKERIGFKVIPEK